MKQKLRLSLLAMLALSNLGFPGSVWARISHLEIGAANYSASSGDSASRFLILEDTAKNLIRIYGDEGVIYLNDIDPSGLKAAKEHLIDWLKTHHHEKISVVSILGDYTKIEFPNVTTAHMKNPDYRQLPRNTPEGARSPENRKILQAINRIALKSKTGLVITTDYDSYMKPEFWPLKDAKLVKTGSTGFAYYAPNYHQGDGYMEAPREYRILPASGCADFFENIPGKK